MNPFPNSHNILPELLNNSDQIYFVVLDQNHLIIEANKNFNKQLSFLDKPIIGKSFSEIIFPQDFSNYQYLLEKALTSQKTSFKVKLRKLNNKGNDFIWTSWEFKVTSLEKGFLYVGIAHTIPNHRHNHWDIPETMNELQVKNEVLDGLFENHLLGFWLWDLNRKKDELSASLLIFLGYDPNDFDSRNRQVKWKKHVYPPDSNKVEAQLKEHISSMGKIPFHCEFRILNLKDEIKYVVCYGKVINWTQMSTPKLMVGGLFDISEKKASEALLEKQNEFLKTLAFNQSHLMRAKLANILGILQVIDMKKKPEEASELLNILKTEANKLDKVLQESIHDSSHFSPEDSA
ncbi:MAG: diguanylate cyclase [Mongoliibacter sp.]|uniref:PAS domain-containing protein n=1 Tax=Mongoliibacter sp. TaxID=2022438 RepID=UPI0012F0BE74|nr:PAS domain-containing protein [Mongoliibacter sp.]TVP48396.1 MAG: diguanylate cyclase [Mongoliibacter sp.]